MQVSLFSRKPSSQNVVPAMLCLVLLASSLACASKNQLSACATLDITVQ